MKVYESAEMYLETILILTERTHEVRMIDIAYEMNFSKPSVSVFLKKLRENGYIKTSDSGYISLTDKGRVIAERVYDRHQSITCFLTLLGVNEETASVDACKMEHCISDETLEAMKAHMKKLVER